MKHPREPRVEELVYQDAFPGMEVAVLIMKSPAGNRLVSIASPFGTDTIPEGIT